MDEKTTNLTCQSGFLILEKQQAFFTLNLRYPKGITFEKILFQLEKAAKKNQFLLKTDFHYHIMYINPNSELITTLVNIYQKHTHDFLTAPLCSGGRTYAKCAPNLVPFGPVFPNQKSLAHQVDESISIDQLITLTAIYTEVLYLLS
ncbi:hypothetical protein [Candidatus Phytoplasma asteris]|uniref:hypothetical protein n=1 Tax=Candidatus Phytoplasma asteris TaxID=85620 RepID=UPI003144D753